MRMSSRRRKLNSEFFSPTTLRLLAYQMALCRPSAETADSTLPAGPAVQLTALLARLPEASSKATIDAIAFDFAFLNSKAARKRLVKVSHLLFPKLSERLD